MYNKKWMNDFETALEMASRLVRDTYSASKLNELVEFCSEHDISMYMDYTDEEGNEVFYIEDEMFVFED